MASSNLTFTFTNSNMSEELCDLLTTEDNSVSRNIDIASAVICSLIFLLGTTASAFVCWIKVYKMETKYRSILSMNLFVSGFISSFFLLLNVVYFASRLHWPFGSFMCKLASSVFHLNMFVCAFIFALLSIDYCTVVLTPIKYNIYRTPHLASREVLVIWIIAVCASVPYMVFKNTLNCNGTVKCLDMFDGTMLTDTSKERQKAMALMAFILAYCLPFLIIISCFVITALVYHRKKTSKYTTALKMIFTMQTVFAISTLPYHVFSLLKMSSSASGEKYLDGEMVRPITISLASLTSCVNPILYALVCPDFKKVFSVRLLFSKKNKALIL